MWLSLVEHSLGGRWVGSSNLPIPTISTSFLLAVASSYIHSASLEIVRSPIRPLPAIAKGEGVGQVQGQCPWKLDRRTGHAPVDAAPRIEAVVRILVAGQQRLRT